MSHLPTEEYLMKGLTCLRRGEYFAAHEEWEIPWKTMRGPVRHFWQAMIQLSVGAYHFERGNLTGCRNLWRKAQQRCHQAAENGKPDLRRAARQLAATLHKCLDQTEMGENPLPMVEHFAQRVAQEQWCNQD